MNRTFFKALFIIGLMMIVPLSVAGFGFFASMAFLAPAGLVLAFVPLYLFYKAVQHMIIKESMRKLRDRGSKELVENIEERDSFALKNFASAKVNFESLNLEGLQIEHCSLSESNVREAECAGIRIIDSRLDHSEFREANMAQRKYTQLQKQSRQLCQCRFKWS